MNQEFCPIILDSYQSLSNEVSTISKIVCATTYVGRYAASKLIITTIGLIYPIAK